MNQTFDLDLRYETLLELLEFFKQYTQQPTHWEFTQFFRDLAHQYGRSFDPRKMCDYFWQKYISFDHVVEAWRAYHYPWTTCTFDKKNIIELVRMDNGTRACWVLANRQQLDREVMETA